jgi:hypothetical protein
VSAPALVITLALEAAPRVSADCLNESEYDRLRDWLASREELLALVARAIELEDEAARAA